MSSKLTEICDLFIEGHTKMLSNKQAGTPNCLQVGALISYYMEYSPKLACAAKMMERLAGFLIEALELECDADLVNKPIYNVVETHLKEIERILNEKT